MKGSATRATAVLHPEDEHPRITGVISAAPHPPGRAGGDKIRFSVGDPGNCPLCVTSLRFEVFTCAHQAVLSLTLFPAGPNTAYA